MKFIIKKNMTTNSIFRIRGRWQWTDAMTSDIVIPGWPERSSWFEVETSSDFSAK